MTAPGATGSLTERDVAAVREAAATGTSVAVWFTAAAVGVPVGGSAKVVAVGDTGEGDFIQVRPAGSRDTMFCSPTELTRTRPTRRRVAQAPAALPEKPARAAKAAKGVPPSASAPPVSAPPVSAPPVSAPPVSAPPVSGPPVSAPPVAKPVPPRRTSPEPVGPRVARSGAMTVTLRATADGEWTVDVLVGKERVVSGAPVPAADVAAAGRSLPPAVAEAIEASLDGARRRQQERVEQLRAELDNAQRMLDQFGS